MTDKRAVVAYRYHLTDVDTWTDHIDPPSTDPHLFLLVKEAAQ